MRTGIRDVDAGWFLPQAVCSFARYNCGLSWPTELLFGSNPKKSKTNPKKMPRYGRFGSILRPVFLEVDHFGGPEVGIEIGQTQP